MEGWVVSELEKGLLGANLLLTGAPVGAFPKQVRLLTVLSLRVGLVRKAPFVNSCWLEMESC